MQAPLGLAVHEAGTDEHGQFAQAGGQTGVVAHEVSQALSPVGEFGAVQPDTEGPIDAAAGGDDGIVDVPVIFVHV